MNALGSSASSQLPPSQPARPWDARIARWAVRPLAPTRITPNHLTTVRLVVGLGAAASLASGAPFWLHLGAGLFLLSNLLDHTDGELARMTGKTSKLGHAYDLACDAIVHTLVFAGLGFGLRESALGAWAPIMGVASGLAIAFIFWARIRIEERVGASAAALPTWGGFEVEDVLYLFGPIVWIGGSVPFLTAAFAGAPAFALWLLWRHRRGGPPAAGKGSAG